MRSVFRFTDRIKRRAAGVRRAMPRYAMTRSRSVAVVGAAE
jgi:hypothetical protein